MKAINLCLLCLLLIGCANKSKQEKVPQALIHNGIEINDTLKAIVIDTTIVLFPYLLPKIKDAKEIYLALTEKPEYPGGMHELITYIQNSIQYPSNAYKTGKQGRAIVQAIIDTDGSIIQPSIIYGVDSLLDKEALRIIQSMPKWKPGKYHGKTIRVKYHFPVTFRITSSNANSALSLTDTKMASNIHWGFLIDENEGITKIYFNKHINQMCREKTEDILYNNTSIFKGKVYISIDNPKFELTYDEAVFYREDRQGKLHKISQNEPVYKESVALMFEKGKAREVKVDLPKNCPTGDYLLKIRLHNEQGDYYEICKWFEAYTSKQVSRRKKPIPVGPGYAPVIGEDITEDNEDDVFEVVQNMPEFPGGGLPKLIEFIQQNVRYPQSALQSKLEGRVIVQIVIDKDGSVIRPKILRSINPVLSIDNAFCEEALRIVSIMPKWKPGSQHEIPVKVKFTFPVRFTLPTD